MSYPNSPNSKGVVERPNESPSMSERIVEKSRRQIQIVDRLYLRNDDDRIIEIRGIECLNEVDIIRGRGKKMKE